MPRNKHRVYVALFFRAHITSEPQLRKEFGHAAYHWAIYVESKDGENTHAFDVRKGDYYPNVPGSGAWTHNSLSLTRKSRTMLCQIMIGKLPPTITPQQVEEILSEGNIPLPNDNTDQVENCVSWTKLAIQALQRKGCAEKSIRVDRFLDFALRQADLCYDGDPQLRTESRMFNATSRPM